jgi:hypothetical protein
MSRHLNDQVYEWNIALEKLTKPAHGFDRSDIEHVEAHWWYYDLLSWSSGYIVGLTDGRRAYIDYVRFQEDDEECIQVIAQLLMATEAFPADTEIPGHWDESGADVLTEALHMPPLANGSDEQHGPHP